MLRPWWARWIVSPLLLLLLARAGLTLALEWRFEARVSELRDAGEPTELRDLAPSPVPETENGASLLLEADRFHEEQLSRGPIALRLNSADWAEDERAELQEWLAIGEPYRRRLARIAARPVLRMDLDWDAGVRMAVPAIPAMRHAKVYLEHRARYGVGGTSESVRDIAVMLGLASKLEHPSVATTLLRWAFESAALTSVTMLEGRPDFDPSAARNALDRRFEAAIAVERQLMRTALQGERTFGISMARRWISGESPTAFLREIAVNTGADAEEDAKANVSDLFGGSWLFRSIAYRDALRLLELMDAHLDLFDLPAREAHARSESLEEEYAGTLPWLISSRYAGILEKLHRGRLRHLARMRIARAGLALLELRQERGEWPRTLDDLVPLIGAEAIVDPFTGDPLQYRPGVRLEAAAPIPDPDSRDEFEIVWRFP